VIRPTTAFCAAAFAAVGVAFGTGYTLYPMQDDVAKLVVVEQPHAAVESVERKDENLHVVREHPMKEGRLVSPFLPEHPTREQARAVKMASSQKPEPKGTRQAPPPAKETEIRLVGVASSEAGRRAILSVGKRQILLAPGEEKDGVTLVSLTEKTATVLTPMGERELCLSAGNIK
jgi:type IV secretory pathway VirB10-like protein